MSNSLHPFLATGRALVDGGALQDNGVCIGLAVLKSTALALCLRKQGEQLLSLNFFVHDWSGAAWVLRLSISALFFSSALLRFGDFGRDFFGRCP